MSLKGIPWSVDIMATLYQNIWCMGNWSEKFSFILFEISVYMFIKVKHANVEETIEYLWWYEAKRIVSYQQNLTIKL